MEIGSWAGANTLASVLESSRWTRTEIGIEVELADVLLVVYLMKLAERKLS